MHQIVPEYRNGQSTQPRLMLEIGEWRPSVLAFITKPPEVWVDIAYLTRHRSPMDTEEMHYIDEEPLAAAVRVVLAKT
jgi:hypothetical protein